MAKLTAAQRKKLPDSAFALPADRRFPLTDAEGNLDKDRIQLAWDMLKRASKLGDDERKAAGKAILKAAKKAGVDTKGWTKKATASDMVGEADEETDPDAILPTAEDLTVETISKMHAAQELCAAWCLTHDMPLTSVERAALQAAVMARCSDLNISMYSWDYYDGGKLAEMHEQTSGTEADAGKAAPALEAIGVMESMEDLRKAYVDVREAELTAEVRDGLESAVRSRAETLGIDWWTWQYKRTEKAVEGAAADDAAEGARFLYDSAGGCEVFLGPSFLLDEGDPATGRPMRRRWRVTRADFINDNRRLYTLDLIQDAVRQANADIAAGRLDAGEMYHPKAYRAVSGKVMFESAFERQVFKWERFHVAEDGTVYGDAQVLEHTPAGAIIGGHVRNGVTVPVSVRWMIPNGSTARTLADGSKVEIPNKPLRIRTVDAVPNPAMGDAVDIQALDSARIKEILAAPTAPAEGAAVVPAPDNPSTNDSGAQGVKEDETVNHQEILEALKTPDGQALLQNVFGTQFDSAVKAAEKLAAHEVEDGRKTAVKAVVDAADLSKFDDATKQTISDAAMKAPDAAQAKVIMDAQIDLAHKMEAKVHAARMGYPVGAAVGQVRVDSVNEAKPWRAAVDKIKAAMDDAGREQGFIPDPSLRKLNAHNAGSKLMALFEQQNGRALYDAATGGAMGDSALTMFDDSRRAFMDDATTTQAVLNQPIIQQALIEQGFQDTVALQFVTTRTDAVGGIFKHPAESYTGAARKGSRDMISIENQGIVEANVNVVYPSFFPVWRRVAINLTKEVIRELKAGPANYDTLGRSLYHIPREKQRVVDLAIYREMLVTGDEYGAVALVDEAQTGGTAVNDTTNVKFKYALKRGGGGNPRAAFSPVVRPREVITLDASGNKQTSTQNQFTLKVAGVAKVRGYLDDNGNIAPYDGDSSADYAVDFETGNVYCTAMTLNPGTVDPVVSYAYATNFDDFALTVPNGIAEEVYFNQLMKRIDKTAALMGSAPRYKEPNLAMMSLNAAANVTSAQIFYKLSSPEGTNLLADRTMFGQRNAVNLARHNAPWDAGDNRMVFTQIGATHYGVAVPFELEGPYPVYDQATGRIKDAKIWYGAEESAIFTPQSVDKNGKVINPVLRSIVFR